MFLAAHCAPNEATKSSRFHALIVRICCFKKLNALKDIFKAKTFQFLRSKPEAVLRHNWPLHLLFFNHYRVFSKQRFIFQSCGLCFIKLSVFVFVKTPCDRGICRLMFDRGKLPAFSRLNSFEQQHPSERKEAAILHQHSFGNATLAPTSACASSLKQLHVSTTFGSKGTGCKTVAMPPSSFDTTNARTGFDGTQLRTTSWSQQMQ